MSVNPALKLDRYSIPKAEDLLATLAGGKSFTKLDLNQAYTQLALDKESKELTVINTHKGLYYYTKLPFGVPSALGIYQKTAPRHTECCGVYPLNCYRPPKWRSQIGTNYSYVG